GAFVEFHSFRLTQFGILFTPVSSTGVVTLASHTDARGSVKISPDGRFIVTGNQAGIAFGGGAHIYDFNNITGVVSNERSLNNTISGYGVGYDACGNFLYVDDTTSFSNGPKSVFQFDLNAANIPSTRTLVYSMPLDARGTLQIGPDGKLYVARIDFPWVGIVDDPSLPMSSGNVNFTANGVDLLGRNSAQGLPTFLQSFFLAQTEITNELGILTTVFCEGSDLNLSLDVTCFDINNVTADWDLGDGTIVLDDVGPFLHSYQAPGDYDIVVLITFPDNSTRTLNVTVTVLPNGSIENEGDLVRFCEAPAGAGFLDIDLPTEFDADVLGGQNAADFTVTYHTSQTDADDNLNPISTLNVTTLNTPVDVWVRMENNELDLCTAVGLFQVIVDEAPVAGAVNDLPVCDIGNDGFEQIDLNQTFDVGVLNGQDPALF
ncbi:MAG: hypothetical protein RQ756_09935, partial [Flavobacteriaceae bacterium]|nr:hypothetical protein [Flavobacteriaceae bacterium]